MIIERYLTLEEWKDFSKTTSKCYQYLKKIQESNKNFRKSDNIKVIQKFAESVEDIHRLLYRDWYSEYAQDEVKKILSEFDFFNNII